MIEAVKVFKLHGVDMIDVSSGGASPAPPQSWPGFQLPYAHRIKTETEIPTIGCGLILEPKMAEEAISDGKTDLIAVGRGMLANPYWPLIAAKELNVAGVVPKQYKMAYPEHLR
jgi:NADPH2 dehydrogenase